MPCTWSWLAEELRRPLPDAVLGDLGGGLLGVSVDQVQDKSDEPRNATLSLVTLLSTLVGGAEGLCLKDEAWEKEARTTRFS